MGNPGRPRYSPRALRPGRLGRSDPRCAAGAARACVAGLLGVVAAAGGPVAACRPSAVPVRLPLTVACLGDSNTAAQLPGQPSSGLRAWCEFLADEPGFEGVRTINFGFGGTVATDIGAERIYAGTWLGWVLADFEPDVVILAYGTNDIRRHVPPQDVVAAYEQHVRRIEAAGGRAYVALTPPSFVGPPASEARRASSARIESLNALLQKTFPPERIVDFWTGFERGDFKKDGLHLGAAAQRRRAAIAARALRGDVPGPAP